MVERRGFLVAAIIVGGFVCVANFAIVTQGACGAYLRAVWTWHHANGAPVPFSFACAPSFYAQRHAIEIGFGAAALATAAGAVAVLAWLAKLALGHDRTVRARRAVGWFNVGALAVVMVGMMAVGAAGDGETQFYVGVPLFAGMVSSGLGSLAGVSRSRPQEKGI
jgi:hypothetical protein